jgi:broad specificity polyphosphatase/5'/3'-nucleotidase SurE
LSGHAAGDRAGPEEADVGDDVLHVPGLQPSHQVLLARSLVKSRVGFEVVGSERSTTHASRSGDAPLRTARFRKRRAGILHVDGGPAFVVPIAVGALIDTTMV